MGITWIISSLLVWALSENAAFLEALIVGACISPTDPVLANTVIKGRFADEQVPIDMAQLIAAESGANDGLEYPFLFLGLWLYRARRNSEFTTTEAMGLWFGDTWAYVVLLSVLWGAVVGYLAGKASKMCYSIRYVDRESFHAFPIFLVLLLIGTCGLIGSDDILSCFMAGNAMSWDDWFRQQTMNDSFQPTLDMMLNQAMFLWLGAACPRSEFANNGQVIGLGRLVALGLLILLLRRPPVIFGLQSLLKEVQGSRNALFMGHFGPIGVSAIFYLYEALEFLEKNISAPEDARSVQHLRQLMSTVVWFSVVSSTVSSYCDNQLRLESSRLTILGAPHRSYTVVPFPLSKSASISFMSLDPISVDIPTTTVYENSKTRRKGNGTTGGFMHRSNTFRGMLGSGLFRTCPHYVEK